MQATAQEFGIQLPAEDFHIPLILAGVFERLGQFARSLAGGVRPRQAYPEVYASGKVAIMNCTLIIRGSGLVSSAFGLTARSAACEVLLRRWLQPAWWKLASNCEQGPMIGAQLGKLSASNAQGPPVSQEDRARFARATNEQHGGSLTPATAGQMRQMLRELQPLVPGGQRHAACVLFDAHPRALREFYNKMQDTWLNNREAQQVQYTMPSQELWQEMWSRGGAYRQLCKAVRQHCAHGLHNWVFCRSVQEVLQQ